MGRLEAGLSMLEEVFDDKRKILSRNDQDLITIKESIGNVINELVNKSLAEKDYDRALSYIDKSLRLNPDNDELLQQRKKVAFKKLLKRI